MIPSLLAFLPTMGPVFTLYCVPTSSKTLQPSAQACWCPRTGAGHRPLFLVLLLMPRLICKVRSVSHIHSRGLLSLL